MVQIVLIRPGSTDLDEQGRIKGILDIPLSPHGAEQVARTVEELSEIQIRAIYTSPAVCCEQTASALAAARQMRFKRIDKFHNVDHGLWHGKLIEEVRETQPKVYRQGQDKPETVCPPEGESLAAARQRVRAALVKLLKKHKDGVIALVAPEPLATVCRSVLSASEMGDLWKAERDCGRWEVIDVEPKKLGQNHE